ncbi:hypothetical protein MPH_12789 [Macrophomina phaseolina MS6]|uniref:Uncharacterized protein n=1 Tax=Macrophomina phaseolina (strain MS6) TaxID=1126212 RepID=K2RJ95_MACPH|nr:hypothetical protein MPH_12789 [Macrophomina phaseolina MS6]
MDRWGCCWRKKSQLPVPPFIPSTCLEISENDSYSQRTVGCYAGHQMIGSPAIAVRHCLGSCHTSKRCSLVNNYPFRNSGVQWWKRNCTFVVGPVAYQDRGILAPFQE